MILNKLLDNSSILKNHLPHNLAEIFYRTHKKIGLLDPNTKRFQSGGVDVISIGSLSIHIRLWWIGFEDAGLRGTAAGKNDPSFLR
jgi:hypothetical protein